MQIWRDAGGLAESEGTLHQRFRSGTDSELAEFLVRIAELPPHLAARLLPKLNQPEMASFYNMIGLVQVGLQQRADRYMNLAMLGLLLAMTGSLPWEQWQIATKRHWSMFVASLVVLMLAVRTEDQVGTWRDSLTLFEHALAVDQRNPWAHLNAGLARQERGDWKIAEEHFHAALAIDSRYALAHYNLGVLKYERGDARNAATHFAEAVRLDPRQANAWVRLGALYGTSGRLDLAEQAFRTACELDSEQADAWFNLGVVYEQRRDFRRALAAYQAALRINKQFQPAQDGLARVSAVNGSLAP